MKKIGKEELEVIMEDLFRNQYRRENVLPSPSGECIVADISDISDDDLVRIIYLRVRDPEMRNRLRKDIRLGRTKPTVRRILIDAYLTSIDYVFGHQLSIPYRRSGMKLIVQADCLANQDGPISVDEAVNILKETITKVLGYVRLTATFSRAVIGGRE